MIKKYSLIFLLFCLAILFLSFPLRILAEIQLPDRDSHYLLDAIQEGLVKSWIDITSSSGFSEPKEQVAILLIREAIKHMDRPVHDIQGPSEISAVLQGV